MTEESKFKRYNITRKFLIFWTLFISIGAFFGGTCMLIKPDGSLMGMENLLPYFQVLPFAEYVFQDYIFPGISLIIVNGITNLIAAIFLIKKRKCGSILSLIFGITLMMWITIQFVIFPVNFMSTIYFIFGIIQLIVGIANLIFFNQSLFHFDEKEYKNIGKDPKVAVVYFSRMGYTKKIAYQVADKLHANIIEVTTSEKTENTLGFWWCGRFAMHRWGMKLNQEYDLSSYQEIVIVSPMWVFHISAPIREFIKTNQKELSTKCSSIYINHFMPSIPRVCSKEIEGLLNAKIEIQSVVTRVGKTKFKTN